MSGPRSDGSESGGRTLPPGTVVDRYTVQHLLGSGGMARVYAAVHTILGTRHALKVLHLTHPAYHERLVREGKLQAHLNAAHILPVTDVVEVHGAPALVMPLVDGCSLSELLAVHRPTEEEAGALFADIVAGVGDAHRAGVVHRDLKPANVLLHLGPARIRVRVADFGVARALHDGPEGASGFVGTPAYAAPEQVRAADQAGPLADLWSLGVLLHEMLAGCRPRAHETLDLASIPERWRPVLDRLLQPSPERRIPSAEALAEAIAALGIRREALEIGAPLAEAVRTCRDATEEAAKARLADTVSSNPAHTLPLPRAATTRRELPRERDPFVGRGEECALLARRLDAGARLITVAGPGGAGKTRLAVRHGWRRLEAQPNSVWFCDLCAARDTDGILLAVGHALGVPLVSADPVARIGSALAGRGRCLLILDNVEQVVQPARELLGRWLELAPEAAFVVTSREILGLQGEEVLSLDPLPGDEARALFLQRAAAADPRFAPTPDDLVAIDTLVELLDGLPLAIELCAARIRVLPPREMLARMSDRFRLLVSRRSATDRHATLRAALDWSWSALGPREAPALAQLSVFEGGFSLDAVEAVVALPDPSAWHVDILQALVDRSLVRSLGGGRFALLHCVRDYATEQLEAADEVHGRHGQHFAALGDDAALDALHRHGGNARRRALALELHNLLAACRSAVARRDPLVAAPTARAAWSVLLLTGPPALGRELLESALALPGLPAIAEGQLRTDASLACVLTGDGEAAQRHADAALSVLRAAGARAALGLATGHEATLHHRRGQLDEAESRYREALAIAREVGHPRLEANVLRNLGGIEQTRGNVEASLANNQAALALHRRMGDRRSEALALGNLGRLYLGIYDPDSAEGPLTEALAACREVGDRRLTGLALGDLSVLWCVRGRMEDALAHARAALDLHREVGDRQHMGQELGTIGTFELILGRIEEARTDLRSALALHQAKGTTARDLANLGSLLLTEGDVPGALATQREALDLARQAGNRRQEGEILGNLGRIAVERGALDEAAAAFGEALAIAARIGQRQLEGAMRGALGDLHRRAGRLEEARRELTVSEAILRGTGDIYEIAKILCVRVPLERAVGDEAAAERARAEAAEIAERLGVGPASPLGRMLAALSEPRTPGSG